MERFVGRYRLSFSRPSPWTLSITRDRNRLSAEILNSSPKVPLYPASNDACLTVEDAMTLKFEKDETGRYVKVTSDLGWTAMRTPD